MPAQLDDILAVRDHFPDTPVRVEGGTTYSLVFYNPQKLDTRAVTFVPDVAVYTGSEEKLPLELSVVGNSHVIALSFTPSETGVNYITVQNAEANSEGATHRYRFDLIEDPAKQGMGVLFKAADGSGYTYTFKDILFLRHELEPYVNEVYNREEDNSGEGQHHFVSSRKDGAGVHILNVVGPILAGGPAAQRSGRVADRGPRGGPADRVPRAGPPILRPGRARHADRVR